MSKMINVSNLSGIVSNISTNTATPGSVLTYDSTGSVSWGNPKNDLVEFVEFALDLMGYKIKYDDFSKLSKDEKKALLRDLKIGKIID